MAIIAKHQTKKKLSRYMTSLCSFTKIFPSLFDILREHTFSLIVSHAYSE